MIPIRDHQGRVVAFTARQTALTPAGRPRAGGEVRQFPRDADLHEGQPALQPGPGPHGGRRGPALRHGRGPARRAALLVGRPEDGRRAPGHVDHRGPARAPAPLPCRGGVLLRQRRGRARRRRCGCCRWRSRRMSRCASSPSPGTRRSIPTSSSSRGASPPTTRSSRSSLSAMAFACRALLPSPATASSEQRSRAAQAVLGIIAAAESEVSRAAFISEAAALLQPAGRGPPERLERRLAQGGRIALRRTRRPPPPRRRARERSRPSTTSCACACISSSSAGRSARRFPTTGSTSASRRGSSSTGSSGELENGNWPGRDHLEALDGK